MKIFNYKWKYKNLLYWKKKRICDFICVSLRRSDKWISLGFTLKRSWINGVEITRFITHSYGQIVQQTNFNALIMFNGIVVKWFEILKWFFCNFRLYIFCSWFFYSYKLNMIWRCFSRVYYEFKCYLIDNINFSLFPSLVWFFNNFVCSFLSFL